MGHRRMKKWPGKKAHRGTQGGSNRSEGSWSGKDDQAPVSYRDSLKEYETLQMARVFGLCMEE